MITAVAQVRLARATASANQPRAASAQTSPQRRVQAKPQGRVEVKPQRRARKRREGLRAGAPTPQKHTKDPEQERKNTERSLLPRGQPPGEGNILSRAKNTAPTRRCTTKEPRVAVRIRARPVRAEPGLEVGRLDPPPHRRVDQIEPATEPTPTLLHPVEGEKPERDASCAMWTTRCLWIAWCWAFGCLTGSASAVPCHFRVQPEELMFARMS
ncbi:hypothetical protein H4W33_003886 [Kibdelosporangium phytohabitans]|nr:hypothetical protein [Kibdelosporangium phytohabitans]